MKNIIITIISFLLSISYVEATPWHKKECQSKPNEFILIQNTQDGMIAGLEHKDEVNKKGYFQKEGERFTLVLPSKKDRNVGVIAVDVPAGSMVITIKTYDISIIEKEDGRMCVHLQKK